MMPNVYGIFEAALFVQNLATARDFYQQVVGLKPLRESDVACVFIVAEDQLLLLISEEKARVPSNTPGGEVPACFTGPGQPLGAGHVAFRVREPEFGEWRTRLESKGVAVLSEVTWEPGGRSLYFRDPDGHVLELATPGVWAPDW